MGLWSIGRLVPHNLSRFIDALDRWNPPGAFLGWLGLVESELKNHGRSGRRGLVTRCDWPPVEGKQNL